MFLFLFLLFSSFCFCFEFHFHLCVTTINNQQRPAVPPKSNGGGCTRTCCLTNISASDVSMQHAIYDVHVHVRHCCGCGICDATGAATQQATHKLGSNCPLAEKAGEFQRRKRGQADPSRQPISTVLLQYYNGLPIAEISSIARTERSVAQFDDASGSNPIVPHLYTPMEKPRIFIAKNTSLGIIRSTFSL